MDPSQGMVQQFWIMNTSLCTRLLREYPRMYTVIGEKAMYITFLMFLGMVKDTSKDKKWSIGANESAAGRGKAIQMCDSPSVVKSAITTL